MRTFTYKHKDDTLLEKDGNTIRFVFWANGFTHEPQDEIKFNVDQDTLFDMMCEYFDLGKHADIIDELTVPGINALWEALYWMNERNIKL